MIFLHLWYSKCIVYILWFYLFLDVVFFYCTDFALGDFDNKNAACAED